MRLEELISLVMRQHFLLKERKREKLLHRLFPFVTEEEEIDVVSVTEKFTTSRTPYNLPTNPSTRDRHHLQKKMATAISNKRLISPPRKRLISSPRKRLISPPRPRIKTIMPMRKPPTMIQAPPVKRRQESRGVKRTLPQKTPPTTTNGVSPFKRRGGYNMHNSDSEPEPSEKRSMHNNMERQRRIDLRNAFEDLRLLVPEVCKKEKAAKVAILREAAQFCKSLQKLSTNMINQRIQLQLHQDNLKQTLRELRIENYNMSRQ